MLAFLYTVFNSIEQDFVYRFLRVFLQGVYMLFTVFVYRVVYKWGAVYRFTLLLYTGCLQSVYRRSNMSKVISFRVSEDEFEGLKLKTQGSVNDYAKGIVTGCIQDNPAVYKDVYKNNDDCIHQNCEDCIQVKELQKDLAAAEETIKISADCSECETKTELTTTLLQIADLKQEIEELRASPAPDCSACEKMAEMDRERAELQAETERLAEHKTNLQGKCDRLTAEIAEARAEAQELSQGKEKDCDNCERITAQGKEKDRIKSSLQSEVEKTERLESALNRLENENNSLKAETEAGKAEVERLQSVVESMESEITKLTTERDAAYAETGIPLWMILLFVVLIAGGFMAGRWI